MTITTEQKLEAACAVLQTWNEHISDPEDMSLTGKHFALATLSTAAKEIEKLTGVVEALEALELMVHLPSVAGTAMHRRAIEALARFKELVG